jgi:hypothetical protein
MTQPDEQRIKEPPRRPLRLAFELDEKGKAPGGGEQT